MALTATKTVHQFHVQCSGAELRDRLALGEPRRHPRRAARHHPARHVVARSGGSPPVHLHRGRQEQAAVRAPQAGQENYGEMTININPGSIYAGSLEPPPSPTGP
jgi:benzoyl-CoA reductase subunit A